MSLWVHLSVSDNYTIMVGGKRISPKEFRETHSPCIPPVEPSLTEGVVVYERNAPHTWCPMAMQSNLYVAIWHPEENGVKVAYQLIHPLWEGLLTLKSNPDMFVKAFLNKQEDYEMFTAFVEEYLDACMIWQTAKVEAYG